jgi:hypothetical protein
MTQKYHVVGVNRSLLATLRVLDRDLHEMIQSGDPMVKGTSQFAAQRTATLLCP